MTGKDYEQLFERLRPLWKSIEKLGWKVERNGNEVNIGNYSPVGEELYETVYLDDKDSIPEQLYKLYDEFDEEEHVVMCWTPNAAMFKAYRRFRQW